MEKRVLLELAGRRVEKSANCHSVSGRGRRTFDAAVPHLSGAGVSVLFTSVLLNMCASLHARPGTVKLIR